MNLRTLKRQGIGGLAQLGEHLLCKQGVVGSIPSSSTNHQCRFFIPVSRKVLAVRGEKYALAIEPVSKLFKARRFK